MMCYHISNCFKLVGSNMTALPITSSAGQTPTVNPRHRGILWELEPFKVPEAYGVVKLKERDGSMCRLLLIQVASDSQFGANIGVLASTYSIENEVIEIME